jgi:hypothetical protein
LFLYDCHLVINVFFNVLIGLMLPSVSKTFCNGFIFVFTTLEKELNLAYISSLKIATKIEGNYRNGNLWQLFVENFNVDAMFATRQ